MGLPLISARHPTPLDRTDNGLAAGVDVDVFELPFASPFGDSWTVRWRGRIVGG